MTNKNQEQEKFSLPANAEGVRTFITKEFKFSATHFLPEHDGICKDPHEHEYKLQITLSGPVQTQGSEAGMIYDFSKIERITKREILDLLIGKSLPDLFDFPTTVENLARWIGHKLNEYINLRTNNAIWITSVILHEDESSYATVILPYPH